MTTAQRPIRTPDQRVRVFVSSTLGELAPERAAVRQAIESLHLTPVMFELGARPHPPRELYRAYLAQSHIFVGLYWERYGWIAPDEEISGLEDEYRLSTQLPRLLYIKEPAPDREPRLTELIERFQGDDTASYRPFSEPNELTKLVTEDLAILLTERFMDAQQAPRTSGTVSAADDVAPPPLAVTPMIGREADVVAVTQMLAGEARLVTLSGAGGIGKSRLALEIGTALRDGQAVHYVPLEAVVDPALVLRAIADRLAIAVAPSQSPLDAIVEALRDRPRLLVLDNFEQVVDAASDIAALLERCPQLSILVTSRQVLRVQAEHEYPVAPLVVGPHVPTSSDSAAIDLDALLVASPAVRLFVERARAARPDFRLTSENAAAVVELCLRLDGLPLAIELAAARVRLLPPAALLERLATRLDLLSSGGADLPERQRTLRAAIDWSYQLLTPAEQDLLVRLSVFAGGASLSAVEAVCAEPGAPEVLDTVSSLLEKSLLATVDVDTPEPRLRLLQTVRTFAAERLAERADSVAVRDRHLAWCTTVTDAVDLFRHETSHQHWPEIEREIDNVRAAIRWALEQRNLPALATLAWDLWPWYWLSGRIVEAATWMEPALGLADPDAFPLQTARLQTAIGVSRAMFGDFAGAESALDPALSYFEAQGDEQAVVVVLIARLSYLTATGREVQAEAEIQRALTYGRAAGHGWIIGYSASPLGALRALRGDIEGSRAAQEECLAAARRVQHPVLEAQALNQLALLDLVTGDLVGAKQRLAAAISLAAQSRYMETTSYLFDTAAALCVAEGRPDDAALALREADAIRARLHVQMWPLIEQMRQQLVTASGDASASLIDANDDDPWSVLRQILAAPPPQA